MSILKRTPALFPVLFGGGRAINYSLRDLFATALDAGAVNGSAAEPGPGTRVAADTESKLTIANGKLTFAGGKASPAYTDPFCRLSQAVLRASKAAAFLRFKAGAAGNVFSAGLRNATSAGQPNTALDYSYGVTTISGGVFVTNRVRINTDYEVCFVLRAAGFLAFIRGGIFVDWTFLGSNITDSGASQYFAACAFDKAFTVDEMAAVAGKNWMLTDFGFATSHTASPTDGQEATMASGNGVIELSWTPGASETLTVMFRRTDDDNCWKFVLDEAANTAKLFSVAGGVATEYASGLEATTLNAGTAYKVRIFCHDLRIVTAVGGAVKQNTYCNDLYATNTSVKVSGSAGGANLDLWPWYATMPFSRSYDYAPTQFLPFGDSKTFGEGYQYTLAQALITATGANWTELDPLARSGASVASMKAKIDTDLALISANKGPRYILFNLGSNDATSLPAEADWKTNALYILDAFHARWPSAQVYMMRPWRRGYNTECDTLAGWIGDVVTARSTFAHLGPDERVFLENGDNGTTYTSDGIHPTTPGYALTAAQWAAAMGY
jgi:lysophospholipase L1-like esterase